MAIREVLTYPKHKAELRRSSAPVTKVNKGVKRLIRDLKDTLKAHPNGIGLSAPQIDVLQRVILVRIKVEPDGKMHYGPPEALINPVILEAHDEHKDYDGCLSFPNLYGVTVRPHYLRVTGFDEGGNTFARVFKGFLAVTVHHEIDHLDGVLFVDRIETSQDLYWIDEKEYAALTNVPVEM